jgi:two-component system, LuxR family, response regulator FixJ
MTTARIVHLVDDDAAVRSSIGGLLRLGGFLVREYPSGRVLLERAAALEDGCILLDLRMPEVSGLEVQAELSRLGIDLPIVFLTAHGDVPTGVSAMKRGAADFLQKPVRESVLVEALRQGFARLDVQVERRAAERRARQLVATMTPREREVIGLVASGLRNRDIAARLDISLQTVKVHRMRAMAKLQAETMLELSRVWAEATGEP